MVPDVEKSAQSGSSNDGLSDKEVPAPSDGTAHEPLNQVKSHTSNALGRTSTAKSQPPLQREETRRPYSGIKWVLVLVALYSAAFLYGLDNTIVADIQAAAVEAFSRKEGASQVSKLAWLGIGFPLGSIAVILPIGKIFGTFDVKWVFIISLVMFEAGSALCGGAPNMDALIVGRVWAGAGGAGMYMGVLNIVSLNTTLKERPIYISGCGLVWGIGCILGPVIGGSFADSSATWRWAFYINLVIFGVCTPIYFFVLESFDPQPDATRLEKVRNIDWVGAVLGAGMYTSFVMAFTFGGAEWAWSDGRTIALIVVFGVLFILFAIQQVFALFTTVEDRLFPVDFLKSRTMVLLYAAMSAACTSLFVPVYYIPLYFSFVHGDSNIDAAVRLLPFICITIFCIMLNGALMPRFGYYMPWYLASGIFLVIGGSLMYKLVDASTPNSKVYGFTILAAVGAGLSQQAAYSVAQAKSPVHRIADAVSFINSAQIGAIVIALTISGAVFQNIGFRLVSDAVQGLNFTEEDIRAALAGAKSTVFETVTPEVRARVVDAIVSTISRNYILVIVAGAVQIVCAFFMKREKLFMETSAGA